MAIVIFFIIPLVSFIVMGSGVLIGGGKATSPVLVGCLYSWGCYRVRTGSATIAQQPPFP